MAISPVPNVGVWVGCGGSGGFTCCFPVSIPWSACRAVSVSFGKWPAVLSSEPMFSFSLEDFVWSI